MAALLGLSLSKIRVLTRFVGGAFGSKAMVWPHVTLTALAAQHVRRPVRLTVPRGQMFTSCGHREEQEQHIELGATSDGKLHRDPPSQDLRHLPVRRLGRACVRRRLAAVCLPELRGRAPPGARQHDDADVHPRAGRGSRRLHPGVRDGRARQRARYRPDRAAAAQPHRRRPEHRPPLVQLRAAGMPRARRRAIRLGRAQPAAALRARRQLADRHRDGHRRLSGRVLHAHPAGPRAHVRRRHRYRADRHPGIRHRHADGDDPGRRRRARHRPAERAVRVRRHRPADRRLAGRLERRDDGQRRRAQRGYRPARPADRAGGRRPPVAAARRRPSPWSSSPAAG